jgi:hypothetical protein
LAISERKSGIREMEALNITLVQNKKKVVARIEKKEKKKQPTNVIYNKIK